MLSQSFPDQVVGYSGRLRGYARKLGATSSLTDDLVQETILRALLHADQFRAGTNLSAWLHTILRHCYFNERRSQRRMLVSDDIDADDRAMGAEQTWRVELQELEKLVTTLPVAQREALALVAVEGCSYDDAALKAGCPTGTMKSRVSRARSALLTAMESSGSPRQPGKAEHLDKAA
jgi:RNA polymerase sigma-70 factor (ECF subfamily)